MGVQLIGRAEGTINMPMVFVSIVGHGQIAVSNDADIQAQAISEMLWSEVNNQVSQAADRGDVRKSISIRTAHVEMLTRNGR